MKLDIPEAFDVWRQGQINDRQRVATRVVADVLKDMEFGRPAFVRGAINPWSHPGLQEEIMYAFADKGFGVVNDGPGSFRVVAQPGKHGVVTREEADRLWRAR